jgi:hypothetical protein
VIGANAPDRWDRLTSEHPAVREMAERILEVAAGRPAIDWTRAEAREIESLTNSLFAAADQHDPGGEEQWPAS